jgi:hypothetical protein
MQETAEYDRAVAMFRDGYTLDDVAQDTSLEWAEIRRAVRASRVSA